MNVLMNADFPLTAVFLDKPAQRVGLLCAAVDAFQGGLIEMLVSQLALLFL